MQRVLLLCLIACGSKVTLTSVDPLLLVAHQEQSVWKPLTADKDQHYAFVAGSTYGLAFGCENAEGSSAVTIIYATFAEVSQLTAGCNLPIPLINGVEISGKFTGLGAGNTGRADIGGQTGTAINDGLDWTIKLPAGVRDFFARRMTS